MNILGKVTKSLAWRLGSSASVRCFASSSQKNQKTESLTIEPEDDLYLTNLKSEFNELYSTNYNTKIPGHATAKDTKYYSLRREVVAENHFRKPYRDDLTISSVGIGTYVGAPDEIDDLKMFNAIVDSVISGGVNVIDTAVNYRYQKSERVVGAALRYLLQKDFRREELFLCSKIGYIPEDADKGISGRMLIDDLIQQKKIVEDEVVGTVHCLSPSFLEDQLDRSLNNIGVETLDLLYIHNAAESQMPLIGQEKFMERLAKAFEFCENQVQNKKIRSYGLATWVCFRAKTDEENLYLSLQKVHELAKKVGGENNSFKYVQMPVNIMMPEAFSEMWQEWAEEGKDTLRENLFQIARRCNINIITSSPLLQGTMIQLPLPSNLFYCANLGAKHIQFSRSLPAQALLTTLVGQKTSRHVKKNLEVIQHPPMATEDFLEFLKPTKRVATKDELITPE